MDDPAYVDLERERVGVHPRPSHVVDGDVRGDGAVAAGLIERVEHQPARRQDEVAGEPEAIGHLHAANLD